MKNSKIFDIIKKSGQAFVFETGNEQWLSDGAAGYSLAGLPRFSKETLLCMLDKSPDEAFPITMDAKTIINLYDGEEYQAEISTLIIKLKKKEYVLVRFGINQGFFVNFKYIKEFYSDYDFMFTVRQAGKMFYLVVYDGMIPVAVVMPANIIDTALKNRIGEISDIINMRMKEAVATGTGDVVPERNILGGWQNLYGGEAEQMSI